VVESVVESSPLWGRWVGGGPLSFEAVPVEQDEEVLMAAAHRGGVLEEVSSSVFHQEGEELASSVVHQEGEEVSGSCSDCLD